MRFADILRALIDFFCKRGISIRITIPIKEWTGHTKPMNTNKPTWIVIHHSKSKDGATQNWDSIRRYHMSYRHNGNMVDKETFERLQRESVGGLEEPWSDIGYHIGIEMVNGKLEVLHGRSLHTAGAHAIGFNDRSIGVCLIGDYDREPPSPERLALLASVCRELQRQFSIPRDQVIGHRETYPLLSKTVAKSCPGYQFNLIEFRKQLIDVNVV